MLGSSRESLAACSAALDARRQAPGFDELAGQLYAVAAVLDDNGQLRSTLADSGQLSSVRESLVRDILGGKVSDVTLDVVTDAVDRRWSEDIDLVVALEQLAAQAAFTVAEADGTLDATEEEIFRFGRAVDSSAELQMALGDPAQTPATKAAIVSDLLTPDRRAIPPAGVGAVRSQRPHRAAQRSDRFRHPRRGHGDHRRRSHRRHRRIPTRTGPPSNPGLTTRPQPPEEIARTPGPMKESRTP